jgi:glucokinase
MTAGNEKAILVYDIGGSHISAAVCFLETYRLGPVIRALHAEQQTCPAFIAALHALGMKAAAGVHGLLGADLAIPGPFDFAAGVSLMQHKLPHLYGMDLRQNLAECFGWEPRQVRFLLDARAFLLGEIGAGAARGVSRVAGVTLGTGIGSAFAIDGEIVTEESGVPAGGEIWNLPYQGGIIEDFVSARAIWGIYKRRTGLHLEVEDLACAAADDEIARETFAEFGRHLGQALYQAVAAFSPDVVVLGGGIARSAHLFIPMAQLELDALQIELRVSALLDDAPLVGAGVAWFNDRHDSNGVSNMD